MMNNKIFRVLFLLIELDFQRHLCFVPDIQMPYKAISGSSPEISVFGKTLTCNEDMSSIKDCALGCLNKSQSGFGCPGFYTTGNNCKLCRITSESEVQSSAYTTFASTDTLYILQDSILTPEIFVDFETYENMTINGIGTTGTIVNGIASDHTSGKNNKGLYIHGGRVELTGCGPECWTNLEHCTSGVTISIWVKPVVIRHSYFVSTGVFYQRGIGLYMDANDIVVCVVQWDHTARAALSTSQMTNTRWHHVVCTYDGNERFSIYLDGVVEVDNEGQSPLTRHTDETDWSAQIGVRDNRLLDFPLDGYVDEFKYFYRILSQTGQQLLVTLIS